MDLISVIVPVYKVEQYLDKCIQSIVDQTYLNLEIILVDDGSPDRCGGMCDEWAVKDDRIQVIHQKNAGGAAARNAGLNIAAGDLIAFVDSDDYLAPTMYERLSDVLCKTGADIAECNHLSVRHDDVQAPECHGIAKLFTTKDALRSNLYNTACRTVIWNKLYRKQVVDSVRFVEGKTIDDEFFTYRVIGNASSVAVIDDCLYFYRQQSQSVMHQAYSLNRLVALEASALRCEYVSARFPELALDARINFWMTCMYNYQMILLHMQGSEFCHAEHRFEELTGCRELYWSDLQNIRGYARLWLALSKLNFKLTCRLRNLFGIGY